MATSDIDIASQSLGLLRAPSIASFDEGTNEADICTLFYGNFVLDILTRYPWSFCTKKRRLNLDSNVPVNEYRYAHIVPANVLRIWALFPSDSVGASPITDYDIQTIDGGRRIFSNHQTLYLDHTYYTAESNWPAYFATFAIKAFAALIAKPVTDQDDLAADLRVQAWGRQDENEQGGAFATAAKIDAHQKPGETIQSSPMVDARFS